MKSASKLALKRKSIASSDSQQKNKAGPALKLEQKELTVDISRRRASRQQEAHVTLGTETNPEESSSAPSQSTSAATPATDSPSTESHFEQLLSFNPYEYLKLIRGAGSSTNATMLHSMAMETLTSHIHSLHQSLRDVMSQISHVNQESKLIHLHLKEKNYLLMKLMKQKKHETLRFKNLRLKERDLCRQFFFNFMRERAQNWSAEKLYVEMEREWQQREELAQPGNEASFWRGFQASEESHEHDTETKKSISTSATPSASAVAAGAGEDASATVSQKHTDDLDSFEQETLDMMREGVLLEKGQIKKYLESMKQEWFLETPSAGSPAIEATKEDEILKQVQQTIETAQKATIEVEQQVLTDDSMCILIGEHTAEALIQRAAREAALENERRKAAELERHLEMEEKMAEKAVPQQVEKVTMDGIQTSTDDNAEDNHSVSDSTSSSTGEVPRYDVTIDTNQRSRPNSGVIRYIGSPLPHTPDAPSPTPLDDDSDEENTVDTNNTQHAPTHSKRSTSNKIIKPQRMQSASALPTKVRRGRVSPTTSSKSEASDTSPSSPPTLSPRHSPSFSSLSRLAQRNQLQQKQQNANQDASERSESPTTPREPSSPTTETSPLPDSKSFFLTETITNPTPTRKKRSSSTKSRSRSNSINAAKEMQRVRKKKALEMRTRHKKLGDEEEVDSYLTDEEVRIQSPTLERQSSLGPVKDFEAKLKEGHTTPEITVVQEEHKEGMQVDPILLGKGPKKLTKAEMDMLRQSLSPTERFFPRDNIRAKLTPQMREFVLSPDVVDPRSPEDDNDTDSLSKKSPSEKGTPEVQLRTAHFSPVQSLSVGDGSIHSSPSSPRIVSPTLAQRRATPSPAPLLVAVETSDASTQSKPQKPTTRNKSVHTSPAHQTAAPSSKVVTIIQQKKESNKRYLSEINELRESLTTKDKEIAHLKRLLKDIENQRFDEHENEIRRALHEERRYHQLEKRHKEEYPTARLPLIAVDNLENLEIEIVDQEEAREILQSAPSRPPLDLPPLNLTGGILPSTHMNRQFLRSAQSSRSARPRKGQTAFETGEELMENFPPPGGGTSDYAPKRRFSAAPPPIPARMIMSARRSSSQAAGTLSSVPLRGNTALYSPRPQNAPPTNHTNIESPRRKSKKNSESARPSTAGIGRRDSAMSSKRKQLKSSQGTRRSRRSTSRGPVSTMG